MSWFGDVVSNLWRPRKEGGMWFYPLASSNNWNDLDYMLTFTSIPEVNAVINLKARAFANGVLKEVDFNGNDKTTPDGQALLRLLKSPNWFQAQGEFIRQTKLFHEIYGNEYIYSLFPIGFDIKKTKALFTIPPNIVRCRYNEQLPFFLFTERPEKIEYSLYNNTTPLPTDQIIHFNDNRVSIVKANDINLLLGESKLKGLTVAVNNLKMAYESRGVIIKNRGSAGILSNKSVDAVGAQKPLKTGEKQMIQDSYRNYGTMSTQDQIIISESDLRWQQMSVSDPVKLGLFQETLEDFNKILDAYGTPSELFVRDVGATYENQHQAEKGLYQNTIIPEADEWTLGLTQRFMPDSGTRIMMEFNHLPVFQQDLDSRGSALQGIVQALSQAYADKAIDIATYKEEMKRYGIGKGQSVS